MRSQRFSFSASFPPDEAASLPPPGTEQPEPPARVLVVDGPSGLMRALGPVLQAPAFVVTQHASANEVRRCIEDGDADLLIIDMNLPHSAGFEMCGELRSTDVDRLTPIILVSPDAASDSLVVRGLICGADDCFAGLATEARVAELQARIRVQLRNRRERHRLSRVRQERDSYRREAVVDTLTGLPNRRSLTTSLERLVKRGRPFALLFVDADHFKKINDDFGHGIGDEVLRQLAGCMRRTMRAGDLCARYGGEEFVIAAPGAGAEQAGALAEALRAAVQELSMPGISRRLSVSVGVAAFDPRDPDAGVDAICKRADAALYEAKRLGRNRVSLAPPLASGRPCRISGISVSGIASVATVSRPPEIDPAIDAQLVAALASGQAGLPLLPAAAAEALRLAEDPRTNMRNIAHLVDRDPPIAARFVALAGSAAYSRGARIVSTHAALVRIGLAASRDLLLQVVYERSNAELPHYQAEVARSFVHSTRAAIAAKAVAHEQTRPYELAYLCGLLHDIGEARVYRILAHLPQPPSPESASLMAERHHQRAGADIARAWRLPADIVDACSQHHSRADSAPTSVRVVRAAEALLGVLEGGSKAEVAAPIVTAAGVRPERIAPVLRELEKALAPPPPEEDEPAPSP